MRQSELSAPRVEPRSAPSESATDSDPETVFAFNGVNASDGLPLMAPLTSRQITRIACGERWDPEVAEDLRRWHEYSSEDHADCRYGVDLHNLAETGWGVVFPASEDGRWEAVREALAPLLHHRRAEATRLDERRYRELTYRPGESKLHFLARHGVGPGPVDPDRLPYYLLLVGGPDALPFRMQFQLDVQYAVGRLAFDTPEEYARYAESAVRLESAPPPRRRTASFFGVANHGDRATERSLKSLIEPLADGFAASRPHWSCDRVLAGAATKAALLERLGGERTPSILFSASHGVGFPAADRRQRGHQGAILCQDWPGPLDWRGPILEDHYLAGDHLPSDAGPEGLIAFHFACYSAGTPRHDSFAARRGRRAAIASDDFIARLPQRLLGHPGGSALAVVGHVDQAWGYSFDWPRAGEQLQVYESLLQCLADGGPVGAAMERLNQRHAELSVDLSYEIEEAKYGKNPDAVTLPGLWTANNDARSYVVLGDPAARLAVGGEPRGEPCR